MKYFSLIIMLVLTLAAAQGTPVSLPLNLEGTGDQISPSFTTTGPWQVQLSSGEVSNFYLYDATTRKNLLKITSGDVIEETGTFFIYVVAPDDTAWTLIVGVGSSADSDTTTDAETTTDTSTTTEGETTSDTTPETTTSTPETTDTNTTPDTTDSASEITDNTEPALAELPPVEKRTEKNWGRHFGFEVSRFTRETGATPGDCSAYANALEAQGAFIEAGGPDLDPDNLDIDGDGYACSYNPFDQSYLAAITCETGKQWMSPRYRKDGTYNPGGCRPIKTE